MAAWDSRSEDMLKRTKDRNGYPVWYKKKEESLVKLKERTTVTKKGYFRSVVKEHKYDIQRTMRKKSVSKGENELDGQIRKTNPTHCSPASKAGKGKWTSIFLELLDMGSAPNGLIYIVEVKAVGHSLVKTGDQTSLATDKY